MMKRVLVTGAHGFIGKAFCEHMAVSHTGFSILKSEVNLCDKAAVASLPEADIIIHLAAKSFIPASFRDPFSFYENNLLSTLNILEKARHNNASVIFISTYVYGEPKYLPVDEKHPRQPLNPYTQSKVLCEDLCISYQRDFDVPVTILRPFNIYGTGQTGQLFIPTILSQLKNDIITLQDPRPRRDYIFIDDVVTAISCCVEKDMDGLHIFNVASGTSFSVKEVVETIKSLSGSAAEIHFTNNVRKGEVLETKANIGHISGETGWIPQTTLAEGLSRTIEWYMSTQP